MTPFRDPPNHAPKIYVSQKMRALYFDATGNYGTDHEVHQWYWESCVEPTYNCQKPQIEPDNHRQE